MVRVGDRQRGVIERKTGGGGDKAVIEMIERKTKRQRRDGEGREIEREREGGRFVQ